MKSKASFFLIRVVVIIMGVSLSNYGFAQSSPEEGITITTYYPSPYGRYKDLQTKRLVIGDDTMPDTDAVVNFQGLDSDPSFSYDGALYYNNVKHEFRYYDGGTTAWRRMGAWSNKTIYTGVDDGKEIALPCSYNNALIVVSPIRVPFDDFTSKGSYKALWCYAQQGSSNNSAVIHSFFKVISGHHKGRKYKGKANVTVICP